MLKKAIIGIILNGAALYGVTYMLDTVNYRGGWMFFVIGGIVIGLLNTLVKPILKLVSFPFVFLSAGLFLIVINMVILWLTKETIDIIHVNDVVFEIEGFVDYLFAGFLFGVINWIEHLFIHQR